MPNKSLGLLCAVLCFAAGALVAYGILDDSQVALMFGIAVALGAAYTGDRVRRESEPHRE